MSNKLSRMSRVKKKSIVCRYRGRMWYMFVFISSCVCVLYSAFISGSLEKNDDNNHIYRPTNLLTMTTYIQKKCYGFSTYVFFSSSRSFWIATGIEQCSTVAIIAKAFFFSLSYTHIHSAHSFLTFWLDWLLLLLFFVHRF